MHLRSQDDSISSHNRRRGCRAARKWGRKQDLGHQRQKEKIIVIITWPTACSKVLLGAALWIEAILINWVCCMAHRLAMFVQGYRVSSLEIQGLALTLKKKKPHKQQQQNKTKPTTFWLVLCVLSTHIHTQRSAALSCHLGSFSTTMFREIACHICKAIQQTSLIYELKYF